MIHFSIWETSVIQLCFWFKITQILYNYPRNTPSGFLNIENSGKLKYQKFRRNCSYITLFFRYYDIKNIQDLIIGNEDYPPIIKSKIQGSTACRILMCRSRIAVKDKYIGLNSTKSTLTKDHSDVNKIDNLKPGDYVSTDQYECRIKGILSQLKVKRLS